jgi:hypothetical protein
MTNAVRKYVEDIDYDPERTRYDLEHNLGTTAVLVQVYDKSLGSQVEVDVSVTNQNAVTIYFETDKLIETLTVVVVG